MALGLERLLTPRAIAIVGAQAEPDTISFGLLRNLERFGYGGDIHLVSRSRDEVDGRPCVKSVDDLPTGVDVAALVLPQAAMREATKAAIARDIGGLVAFASGFAETGDAGRALQQELAALCREAGVALLGPNCLGFTNFPARVPLTFEPQDAPEVLPGPQVGIVAQSGAMAANIRLALHARGIGIALAVSTGNEAQLGIEDFLDHLVAAGAVAAIAVYAEQIRRPRDFLIAARAARERGIPVVLLHPGASARSRAAALSHTGAIAGDHGVMRTVARSAGVVVVETTEELFDVTAVLARYPLAPGGGAALVTNSGATRSLAYDLCEALVVPLAELSDKTRSELRALVPSYVEVDNPLDIGTSGFADPTIYGAAATPLLESDAVGAVLLSYNGGSAAMQRLKAGSILPIASAAAKPVLLNITGDDYPLDAAFLAEVRASGLPFFRSPERALRALRHVFDRPAASPDVPPPGPVLTLPGAAGPLDETTGKALLRQLGVAVPEGGLAAELDAALQIAEGLGYPVALKAHSAALTHKSDVGGVILAIEQPQRLCAAWDELWGNLARAGVTADAVLVERMAGPGLEMVVGGRRDPDWGPALLVGLGGVWIEALGDVQLLPPDIDAEDGRRAILALRAAKLVGSFRGRPARDVEALADVVVRLGAAMRANPRIAEFDLNPVMLGAAGEGAIALDALFVLGE